MHQTSGSLEAPGRVESVERVLNQHEQVALAAVVPWDGDRLVAYVVPAAAGKAEAQVEEWRQIYDRLYEAAATPALEDNFAGWISSYTRRPIDLVEMRQWRSAIVNRVRGLGARRVLEIGVGSGLLLSRLAPGCEAYWATDLSPVAVEELSRHVKLDPVLAERVTLRAQGADRVDGLPTGYFDTVIVNSVVQLFPGHDYLTTVIERALTLLAPGGALFLGDIRDARTLRFLHAAVALGRSGTDDADAVLRAARRSQAREEELLVHPGYFAALPATVPGIAGVDVQLKRGRYHNELSRHRYDVVLHKAPAALQDVTGGPTLRWGADVGKVAGLAARLPAVERPLRVTGIPNARLTGETAAWQALVEGAAGRARLLLTSAADAAVDPQTVADLAGGAGLDVALAPSPDRPDHFEAVFFRPHPGRTALAGTYRDTATGWRAVTGVPAAAHRADALATRLRAWLGERLPAHLVPAEVIPLDTLPVGPDGALDRRSLPQPHNRQER